MCKVIPVSIQYTWKYHNNNYCISRKTPAVGHPLLVQHQDTVQGRQPDKYEYTITNRQHSIIGVATQYGNDRSSDYHIPQLLQLVPQQDTAQGWQSNRYGDTVSNRHWLAPRYHSNLDTLTTRNSNAEPPQHS
jgi:hypothetical protein